MMNNRCSMGSLYPHQVDGILFADPFDALDFDQGITSRVLQWRPTFGGKLLASFDGPAPSDAVNLWGYRRWQWPIIPVELVRIWDEEDVWITGTVGGFSDDEIRAYVEPEVNKRRPHYTIHHISMPCISQKLAHRVLWCSRPRGMIVSDPLYRATFTDMEAALAFLERRKMRVAA